MAKRKWSEIMKELYVGKENEVIQNPFSGQSATLDPVEVAVYDYIKGCEMTRTYTYFDDARYWFMKKNSKAYMTLLD